MAGGRVLKDEDEGQGGCFVTSPIFRRRLKLPKAKVDQCTALNLTRELLSCLFVARNSTCVY